MQECLTAALTITAMEKPWRGPKGSAELVLCQAVILGLSFRSAKEATFTAAFAEQKATKRLM